MTLYVFRVEFTHAKEHDRLGIEHIRPDVRFIVAPEKYYVRAYCDNIKWLWGGHPYEVLNLGSIDKIIDVRSQP